MAIEIVSFPIKNGGSVHSYVSLPEGIYIRHHWTMFRTSPGLWYLRGLQLSVVLDLRHENCHLRGCHWPNTSRNVHGLSNMVPECVDFPCYHVYICI